MSSEWGDTEFLPDTTVARAWVKAEQQKAEDEARRLAAEEELARVLVELHVYDTVPYFSELYANYEPHTEDMWPTRLYDGTGIGALYGMPGSERLKAELGDWKVVSRRTREEGV